METRKALKKRRKRRTFYRDLRGNVLHVEPMDLWTIEGLDLWKIEPIILDW